MWPRPHSYMNNAYSYSKSFKKNVINPLEQKKNVILSTKQLFCSEGLNLHFH